jgi:ribonuclease III
VARELFDRFPDFSEGRMAKIRSHVVSRASCAVVAKDLGLGERLRKEAKSMPEEEADRLCRNRNVLAAVLEASFAALYLEHGFEPVAGPLVDAFRSRIDYALTNQVDYKTDLQEALARRGRAVNYTVVDVEGPPHDRRFTAAAMVDGEEEGIGRGKSKKDAEQEAAKLALSKLGLETPAV